MLNKGMPFKVLVFMMIVALMSASSVMASKSSIKPPNWKSAAVTLEDIQTFKGSASTNRSYSLVSDKKLSDTLRNELSENSELIAFSGIQTPDLKKSYATSVLVGKSLSIYDVYAVTFESANWTILATYDIDRNLLIDAVFLDHADESNVKVIDRNVGVLFQGTLAELMTLKGGSAEEVAKIKAKQKNPLMKEESKTDKLASMLTIEKASAGGFCGYDSNGNPLSSSEVCGWVGVGYCAAAGLLGFWPGLVCAVTFMWGCTYQCN